MTDPIYGDLASYSPLRPMMLVAQCDFCGATELQAALCAAPGAASPRTARAHICGACALLCHTTLLDGQKERDYVAG